MIDDRLLLDGLAGRATKPVTDGLANGEVFTTSSWYYRLGRAAFGGSGTGSLSGRLERLDGPTREHVRAALQDLPEDIGLLHARVVVPVVITLRAHRQLNVLTAEALAVAILVDARLLVTVEAPLLRSGAAAPRHRLRGTGVTATASVSWLTAATGPDG